VESNEVVVICDDANKTPSVNTTVESNEVVFICDDASDTDNVDSNEVAGTIAITKTMYTIYNMGGLGSDGSGGSCNGEAAFKGCTTIACALDLNFDDVLMDIGSSGGLTLAWLNAISNCKACIGVEVERDRHVVAETFNLRLMKLLPDFDCRIIFHNSNIDTYINLMGVTKLYMYDKVFNTALKLKIGKIVNKSLSIQYIASTTKDLDSFGFNVTLVKPIGSLVARGGKMSHTFYLYKHDNYSDSADYVTTPHIQTLIQIASNKQLRLERLEMNVDAVLNSERSSRSKQLVDAGNATCEGDCATAGKMLYSLLMKKSCQINDFSYIQSRKTKNYVTYNETPDRTEVDLKGLVGLKRHSAVIAPCWDGNEDGIILIKLVQRNFQRNNPYIAIIYDIQTDEIAEFPVKDIFDQFNYECGLPSTINIESLLNVS
jgi:precorrin-6B methylase 2